MNCEEVCRVCLNASDELKSLHAKLYGKNKTIVETINFVVNINIELGKGLPNKICSDCENKLTIADVFKQGCLESEAILGQHVNIKKEKGYEELSAVLSKQVQEPAEYSKKTGLSSVAHNSSTDLLENKTEDLIISSISQMDADDYVMKVELDDVHDHDETTSESHDHENYTEELENETEQDYKTEFTKKDYDKLIKEILKSSDKVAFYCALCKVNFFESDDYKAHLLSHCDLKNLRNFECGLCGEKFQCQYTFNKHLGTHVPSIKRISSNMYPCKTCDQEFTVKSNLTKHIQNGNCHQYTCTGCENKILDKESLEIHEAELIKVAPTTKRPKFGDSVQKVIPSEIECPESNSSTATITNPKEKSEDHMSFNMDKIERPTHQVKLNNNKVKKHITETNQFDSITNESNTNNLDYYPATTNCDNKMSSKTEKQRNRSSDYGFLSCDICEYIISASKLQSLNSHLKAHAATMRYSCDSCLFIATDFRTLKIHAKLHTGKKPYFCNVCDKKFSDKSNLDKHLRLHIRLHTNEKPYSCNICAKKFSRKGHLNVHVRLHTGEKPYSCIVCDKKFSDKTSLRVHVNLHTGEKPYFCDVCNKKFSQKGHLNRHVKSHTGEKPYFCNICDKKFSRKDLLRYHVSLHTGKKAYPCNICDKKFSCKSNFDAHVRLHTGEKPYFCRVCDKKFSRKGNLDVHVRLHTGEKPYTCNICDKKFTHKGTLRGHIRFHTNEKPYSCNICDKKFSQKQHLSVHVRLHTGEKRYVCNICEKKFTYKTGLDAHLRFHTDEKPYSCNICDKKFTLKSTLRLHIRLHTNEKPYSCNLCDKKFYQKGHLNQHVRVHTGEKPYSCDECDKKFSDKSSLRKHVKIHTGEKPYACNICAKKYSDKGSLRKHVKKLHTGDKP